MGTFEYSDSAEKKFEKSQQKLQALYKGTGYKGTESVVIGVDMGSKPSFSDSVLYDKKFGLYLPVKKWNGLIMIPSSTLSTTASEPVLGLYTGPWDIGISCMMTDLIAAGFYNKRLAEQMYLASRVFDHNLAVRARQHRMRVR